MARKTVAEMLLTKDKWGRLTPISFSHDDHTVSGKKRPVWTFGCECGKTTKIRVYSVTSGKTASCGCIKAEQSALLNFKHGAARTGQFSLTYRSWRNMLTRARNPNIANAHRYVERGISVVHAWDPAHTPHAFQNFVNHVGERPNRNHVIDRIDPDRSYEPGNVRWVHVRESREITNKSRFVIFNGLRLTVAEAARQSGVKSSVIRDRLALGWSYDRLFEPRARAEFGLGKHSRKGVKPRK